MSESAKFSISDTLKAMRVAFADYRPLIIRITLLFAALNALTALLDLTGPAGIAVYAGCLVLLGAMYGGLITALICLPGKPESAGELWQAVRPVLAVLIWVTLVYAVAMFAGMLALIVPGLIIATIWAVSNQAVVVERLGVFASLKRSSDLVRGHGFSVFGFLIVLVVITLVLSTLVLLVALPLGEGAASRLVAAFLSNLISAPVFAIGLAALYNELTGQGLNPETPAAPEQEP